MAIVKGIFFHYFSWVTVSLVTLILVYLVCPGIVVPSVTPIDLFAIHQQNGFQLCNFCWGQTQWLSFKTYVQENQIMQIRSILRLPFAVVPSVTPVPSVTQIFANEVEGHYHHGCSVSSLQNYSREFDSLIHLDIQTQPWF